MKKSHELKLERSAKVEAQGTIIQLAKKETREFLPDENEKLNALDADIEALDASIASAEKTEERELRIATHSGKKVTAEGDNSEKKEQREMQKRFSVTKALREASNNNLSGLEKELNDEAKTEARNLGLSFAGGDRPSFSVPASMVRATSQSVTQDSGNFGGQLVASNPMLVDSFMPKLFLEQAGATFMSGLVGNVPLPVAGNYDFEWVAENGASSKSKVQMTGPVLKPKRATAQVGIQNQLLLQSSPGVDQMIWNKLREGAARALNAVSLNGDGVLQPLGILNTPGINVPVSTTPAAATWARLVALKTLIDAENATDVSRAYVMSPELAGALEVITKDAGSGMYLLENGKIAGYQALMTSLMPELAGNQVAIFGDFSQLFIGQWGGVRFVIDPYTGASTDEIITHVNMLADVQIANPKAFAADKFFTV
jgi:HK97 family phage major capsid protein